MPFDLSELAALLGTMFVGASALLFVAAIGWRGAHLVPNGGDSNS